MNACILRSITLIEELIRLEAIVCMTDYVDKLTLGENYNHFLLPTEVCSLSDCVWLNHFFNLFDSVLNSLKLKEERLRENSTTS